MLAPPPSPAWYTARGTVAQGLVRPLVVVERKVLGQPSSSSDRVA
jgi:hypothetical protein